MKISDKLFISALFAFIAIALGADVWGDSSNGAALRHMSAEVLIILSALIGFAWIWRDNVLLRGRLSGVAKELQHSHQESERWRQEHLQIIRGLGMAIEEQLEKWSLSGAERDVAMLLLKGCSFKEIATLRNTSEKTVRQHSLKVYEKSGLSGRAELSAFFLEDLLNPMMDSKSIQGNQGNTPL